MARDILTALDVGTSTVQSAVAERSRTDGTLRLLGIGSSASQGMRRGFVADLDDASACIRQSLDEASRSAGVPIRSVLLCVGGVKITVSGSQGVVAVSRADGEIAPEDVRRAVAAAETFIARSPNREVLHVIPREFRVDQEEGVRDPVGMHGVRLEVDTLIVECSAPALRLLFKAVENAGVRPADYIFSPLAASEAVLTKRQKELGVLLLDIGGGTADFVVFEEGAPVHGGVLPLGGNHITNDIALGFRTHVDIAERIKLSYGSCLPEALGKKDAVQIAEFVPDEIGTYSRRELAEMVRARLGDIFELIQKELKKINRKELLPAGCVIIGGSAGLPGLRELARAEIGLPVEIGSTDVFPEIERERTHEFAAVLGALLWAHQRGADTSSDWDMSFVSRGQGAVARWLKSLLP